MQRNRAAQLLVAAVLAGSLRVYGARLNSHGHMRANPVRKVISMLQMMQEKVHKEGLERKDLYDKYMCYCKEGTGNLQQSIAAAEDRIPQLESNVKEASAVKQQLDEEVKQHKKDREEATKALEMAIALRKKNHEAFLKEKDMLLSNLKALQKAITALEKGQGNFLQTGAAEELRTLSVSMDMSGADRDLLSSFLSGGAAGQAPAKDSNEVLGMLKQMHDTMSQELEDITSAATTFDGNQEALISAKRKELAASTKAIEDKMRRLGDLAVKIVQVENDLENTRKGLDEDRKFTAGLGKSCETKKLEWEVYQKTQSEETVALAETIRLLNDDDALDIFKRTLPSPAASFLQVDASSDELRQSALQEVRSGRRGDPRMDLLALAMRGQKQGLDDLIRRVDELADLLRQEQLDDENKKEFCISEIQRAEDEDKASTRSVSDTRTVIADVEDELEEVKKNINDLTKGIKDLDKQVEEATATRKAEHAESVENLASNSAAKSLLEIAKNRLYKFYNKKLYVKPPRGPISEEDRIVENMGGKLAPTPAPGGIDNTGISALQDSVLNLNGRIAQAPPADLTYVAKTAESGGVLAMLDLLRSELSKKITELESEESHSQEDYEHYVKDCASKRAVDSKAVASKESAKAALEATLLEQKATLKGHKADRRVAQKELAGLHSDCDWLLKNFDLRKQARTDEADALQKAKAVLSGADYS